MKVTIAKQGGGAELEALAAFYNETDHQADIFFSLVHSVHIDFASMKIEPNGDIVFICKPELERINVNIAPLPQQDMVRASEIQQGLLRRVH